MTSNEIEELYVPEGVTPRQVDDYLSVVYRHRFMWLNNNRVIVYTAHADEARAALRAVQRLHTPEAVPS